MNVIRPLALMSVLLLLVLVATPSTAQTDQAAKLMENLVDAHVLEQVDYDLLATGYDEVENVLYVAAYDAERYDPPMEVLYSIPIAAIREVKVTSHSDVHPEGEKPYSRGCGIELYAAEADFGWAGLAEGWVTDGEITVEYEELVVEPTKKVGIGFFRCEHARKLQRQFEELRHAVRKDT